MKKQELLERIEHLERRVADLEAIVAARPAGPESVTYTLTVDAGGNIDITEWGHAKLGAGEPCRVTFDGEDLGTGTMWTGAVEYVGATPGLPTFPSVGEFAGHAPEELRI